MNLIIFLFRLSPRNVIFSILFGILSGVANISILAVISGVATKNNQSVSTATICIFIGLCVVMPLARFVSETVLNQLSQGAMSDMRSALSRRILSAPLRNLERLGSPRLYAALTEDILIVTNALFTLPRLCINIATVISCLTYIGWLSPTILVLVLGFMALGVATYQVLLNKSVSHQRASREEADLLFSHFRSLSDGTKELKLHRARRHAFLSKLLQPTIDKLRGHNLSAITIMSAANSWGQVLLFILMGCMLFILPNVAALGSTALIGSLITILYMMTPVDMTLNMLPILTRAGISLKKVERLGFSIEAQPDESASSSLTPPRWNLLELVGVTHTYQREQEDDHFTLGPINLAFQPGEIVFIVGGNGSGKTTLIKLIIALYTPETGEIRLDGQRVTDSNREDYQQNFSVVFSDFHLFESLLGIEELHLDEKAQDYLRRLHLSHKVRIKDGAFSTTELSQGQRKRLALLTAYLEDRSIYVFDEWAADQDPLFKEIFYHQLLPDLRATGKTVLVISHDDRYYHIADRVVKLDYGKLIPLDSTDNVVPSHAGADILAG